MNDTNRGVNRIVLFLAGVVLITAGGAVATAALWPAAGEAWRTGASTLVQRMQDTDQASRVSEATMVSWLALAVLAALLLIVIIAVIVIARLGGGRSSTVIRDDAGEGAQGAVTIRHGFASDAITHSLATREEILSSRVSAHRVRGDEVLHVSVTARRNTSPIVIAETVTRLVDNLETLTGRGAPTLVSIRSGIRSRLAADRSRVH